MDETDQMGVTGYIVYGTGATLEAVALLGGAPSVVGLDDIPQETRVVWDRNRDGDSIVCSMSAVRELADLAYTGQLTTAELVRRIGNLATEAETRMSAIKSIEETRAGTDRMSRSPRESTRLREVRTYGASTSVSGAVTALQEWIERREGVRFGDGCVGPTRLLWQAGRHWALSESGVSLTMGSDGPQTLLLSVRVRKDPRAEHEDYVLVELHASDTATDEVIGGLGNAMDSWWPRYERHKDRETLQSEVNALEARMRDFIDSTLRSKDGEEYERTAVPDEVRRFINGRISKDTNQEPYLRAEGLSARERLDYCDISHYEKLIEKNWDVFETVFGSIAQLQQNLEEWKSLRNSLMHTRKPTRIQELRGEAAIWWLNYAMDAAVDATSSASGRSSDITAV